MNKKMRLTVIALAIAISASLSSCQAWEDHKRDNWPATGNPVSELFDKAVCASPDSQMPQCK